MNEWTKKVRENFKFLDYAPIVFLSALENKRVQMLFPQIELAYESYNKRVQTSILNDVFNDAIAMNLLQNLMVGNQSFIIFLRSAQSLLHLQYS